MSITSTVAYRAEMRFIEAVNALRNHNRGKARARGAALIGTSPSFRRLPHHHRRVFEPTALARYVG